MEDKISEEALYKKKGCKAQGGKRKILGKTGSLSPVTGTIAGYGDEVKSIYSKRIYHTMRYDQSCSSRISPWGEIPNGQLSWVLRYDNTCAYISPQQRDARIENLFKEDKFVALLTVICKNSNSTAQHVLRFLNLSFTYSNL